MLSFLACSPSQSKPVGFARFPLLSLRDIFPRSGGKSFLKGRAFGSPRKLYLFAKASPFGRGVTAGDGEGEDADLVQQTFCLLSVERFRMAAACALAIISGIVIYNIRTAKPAGLAVRLFTRGEKRQSYFSTLLNRMRSLSRFLPAFSRNFSSRSSTVILLRAAPFTSNTMRPASIIRVRLPSSSA